MRTLCLCALVPAAAAFSMGPVSLCSTFRGPVSSRLTRARSGPGRAGAALGLRMGFLDNMFKPKVSDEDPVWMQRDFQVKGRKDGAWEQFLDDATGEIYYYNDATQETLWEAEYLAAYPPVVEAAVAAPPPPQVQRSMIPAWMQNAAAKQAAADAFQGFTGGGADAELDANKLNIRWRAGGGGQMMQGGFGFVYLGTYDARASADAARNDIKIVVKVPTTDPDAVAAFESEMKVNQAIASAGGIDGVAEFLGVVDLSPIQQQLPPNRFGTNYGLVWTQVQGKTLDTFFDRGGGMSPILANTLNVRNSPPVQLGEGQLAFIKIDLCKRVMEEALKPLVALHDQGIIHRDLKPQNLMLLDKDKAAPFRVIDFGSAVLKGQSIVMDDYTEIYAPPEAPSPDSKRPDAYDIYTIGVIGLRCLMPSLLAGELGVQTFGRVTCSEFPQANYDFRAWATGRAYDLSPTYADMAINSEVQGLINTPQLYELMADMLDRDPAKRPSARDCLARLAKVQ